MATKRRGRPPMETNKKLDCKLNAYCTRAELDSVIVSAAKESMTISEYVRERIFSDGKLN
jgi:hypothetical protein